jgi:hypothetical protein
MYGAVHLGLIADRLLAQQAQRVLQAQMVNRHLIINTRQTQINFLERQITVLFIGITPFKS